MPEGATVEIVAVVLDDGTALGDETVIGSIFARRAKERDALGAVARRSRTCCAPRTGSRRSMRCAAGCTAIAQREESLPCRAAIDAVDRYRTARADPAAIDQSLGTYAAFVTREYDIAAKHAQRKTVIKTTGSAIRDSQLATGNRDHQPTFCPFNCSSSHVDSGAK